MLNENSHPTDQELLLAADGELSTRSAKAIRTHLSACWHCRARMSDLEAVIVEFARVHHQALDAELPPIDQSRAQLIARLSLVSGKTKASSIRAFFQFMGVRYSMVSLGFGFLVALLLLALLIGQPLRSFRSVRVPMAVASPVEDGVEPNPKLTPGAIRQVSMREMCAVSHEEVEVDVPDAVREEILHEYGISEKRKGDYEIDFLIAPRLGGIEDPQNLWPEPYASPVWNARVKDDLEERLHALVCSGKVDLKTAQNDISADWIGAYKKYFNTDRPVSINTRVGVNSLDSQSSKQNHFGKLWLSRLKIRKKIGA
jgi:anti-sigma factor RsiW